ncbi:co-chaperone GroES [bacterium]|nr:co-chaperone GroES [bacterium]
MKLKPLHSNVIVKAIKADEVTPSGIVLPETVDKDKPEQGEVIAVGEGALNDKGERVPVSVKTGDKVVFKKYSPDEVKIDNEKYLVINERDILAVIE